ncbi:MAG TPA: hypothetical protein VGG27_03825 [Magnetospirillaceae bacterium]|jgi:predicted DNA-binding transcriptional regulator AlpA
MNSIPNIPSKSELESCIRVIADPRSEIHQFGDVDGIVEIARNLWLHAVDLRACTGMTETAPAHYGKRIVEINDNPLRAAVADALSAQHGSCPPTFVATSDGPQGRMRITYDLPSGTAECRFIGSAANTANEADRGKKISRVPTASVPPPAELVYLDAGQLAQVLRCSKQTIYNRLSSYSWSLPPPTRLPGTRGPRWLPSVVREWQLQHQRNKEAGSRQRGRPTKAQQIAKRASEATSD